MNQVKKPNVVFILADDLGWGEPGCYGNTLNETPNVDAMAAAGMRFTSAYASSTVCSPSRAGLMTGQTPPRNGITDYLRPDADWCIPLKQGGTADNELPEDTDFRLSADLVTLAQMFKKRGYATGMIGKWHLSGYDEKGVKHGPEKYGFDDVRISEQVGISGGSYFHPYDRVDPSIKPVLGEREYLVDRMNHEAVEFIKAHKDEPFFLYLSHYAVHTALVGKKADVEYFSAKAGCTDVPYGKRAWLPEKNPVLAAMLKSIDDGVGAIRKTLRELGLDRDTILVFTSDNGGETKVTVNGHLRDGKSSTYEGGLRVPLVVEYPAVTSRGGVTDVPTINLDFYPTFAELIGYEIPKAHITDGASILPVLRGDADTEALNRRLFSWHYPLREPHFLGGRSSAANRRHDFKYVHFFDDGTDELYNLRRDEAETTNLVATHPDRRNEQRALLRNWIAEVKGTVPPGQKGLGTSTAIDAIKRLSAPYRGWHYHPDHVITAKPSIKGFEKVHMVDVPTVYQLPGDDTWYMSFIGFDGKGYQSFVAESDDLVNWDNMRLAMGFGKEGEFDFGGCVIGAFLYEDYDIKARRTLKKKDGKFWTLYGAYPRQGGYELRPGYEGVACSDDGLTWQRAKDEPILSVHQEGCGTWEHDCIYQPWLVEHEGRYYNFYNAANGHIEQMGLALSDDLLEWKRVDQNPVIPVGPEGSYNQKFSSDGKVFRDGDHWVCFFFGLGKGGAHIMSAFSRDLHHWTVDPEPLYKAGGNPSGLDKQYAHKMSLVWNPANETFYLFYNAVGNQGRGIGLVTSRPL